MQPVKVNIQPKVACDSQLPPNSAIATANANIALIKYWGKRDGNLILPYTSSLSLTLSDLYTTTSVSFDNNLHKDCVTLNSLALLESDKTFNRVVKMLDLVREIAGISTKASVVSKNHVPTAAGLASSASGFAALASAAAYAAGLNLTPRELSRLARRGSGSACRSIFGGLVVWNAGESDETSYAEPLELKDYDPKNLPLAMIVCVLNDDQKPISSRNAMRQTVETSPAFMPWVEQSKNDLLQALDAIRQGDVVKLGDSVECNAFGMHETMHKAVPSVNYLTNKTYAVLKAVKDMRSDGFPVWATMDAGPNVKVLTVQDSADSAMAELCARVEIEDAKFTIALPGSGVSVNTSLK